MTTTNSLVEIECAIDEAAELLEEMTEQHDQVMLWGAPGIGKSDIVRQLGAKKNRCVIDFRVNLREPVDMRGIPVADPVTGTTRWLVPDELPRVDRDGEEGYLFLDEINTGTLQMMAVCFGLVLDGKVGDYRLPPGWRIIAAGNRVTDRAAAQRMPTALRNRFAHLYITPDVPAWCKWAVANDVPPEFVAFIRLRPDLLHRMPKGDENTFPTPRSLTKASKYVTVDNSARRQKLFAAHVGADVAGEANGFIELYKTLGDIRKIADDPDAATVPAERSQMFAVATGLARLATRKTFANLVRYVDRLHQEYQVLFMHDACIRDATLKETAAYSAWVVKHQDVILQS
jgi:hypothetical protein